MKLFIKILKDESGRQIEGMILIAIAGIIVAILPPLIKRFFGLSNSLSFLIAIAIVFALFVVIIVIPNLIRESQERKRDGIHLWNPETGKTALELSVDYSVYSLAFSPDGKILAYCCSENMVCLEAATGKELFEEDLPFGSYALVVFSHDGNLLATADEKYMCLWNANTWKEIRDVTVESEISSLAFSNSGDLLASNRWNETTLLWRLSNGIETFRLEGHESTVYCTAFSSDSNLLASGSDDGEVRIWSVDSGKSVKCLTGTECAFSMAFSPDGRFLATGGAEGMINVWEITTGEELMELKGHKGAIQTVTFSPNGKLVASGGSDRKIRIWDVASGNLRMNLKGNLGAINAVAFSPDGRVLASGSDTPW
jgi:WD40 repeat protein